MVELALQILAPLLAALSAYIAQRVFRETRPNNGTSLRDEVTHIRTTLTDHLEEAAEDRKQLYWIVGYLDKQEK